MKTMRRGGGVLIALVVVGCGGTNAASGPALTGRASPASPATPCTASPPVELGAGGSLTCARQEDGHACCWGSAGGLALGPSVPGGGSIRGAVAGVEGAQDIGVGRSFACAVVAEGAVSCWGEGADGQLGDGRRSRVDLRAVAVSGVRGATQVCAGYDHACALLSDGSVRCWGGNSSGQLGDGTTTTRATPVAVAGIVGAVELGCGDSLSCARLRDGSVSCWGTNSAGELGAEGVSSPTPRGVPGIAGATGLVVGYNLSCARVQDRHVCWGAASPLGDPALDTELGPKPAPMLDGALAVSVGGSATIMLRADGSVATIQGSSGAELAALEATAAGRAAAAVPATRIEIDAVLEVVAGENHFCSRQRGGSVRCWGDGERGQLGDGDRQVRSTPVLVRLN